MRTLRIQMGILAQQHLPHMLRARRHSARVGTAPLPVHSTAVGRVPHPHQREGSPDQRHRRRTVCVDRVLPGSERGSARIVDQCSKLVAERRMPVEPKREGQATYP